MSNPLQPHGLYSSWNSPGQNNRMGILSLLQGIFPTQESNPSVLHCRQILYQLSHKRSPRKLERVTYPFSIRSSHLGIELGSPAWQVDSLPPELSGKPKLRFRTEIIVMILSQFISHLFASKNTFIFIFNCKIY